MYFYNHLYKKIYRNISEIVLKFYLSSSKVKYSKDIVSFGIPYLDISQTAKFSLGKGIVLVNSAKYSTLGKPNKCKFTIGYNAVLIIGNKVGMSNVTIIATKSISIGDNVLLGGGVTIVDTDFHSLNPLHWFTPNDELYMKNSNVVIGDNVFIGMDSIILKGVTIGHNVVIAAGSVVTKSIPNNQIWGGNPAIFIKDNL
ncbi:MAG: acyltransferase [Pedobacter sp.]|nr:MAG: acyltransferase [Pedobacter sp.]